MDGSVFYMLVRVTVEREEFAGFMFILGVNMEFGLKKSLMSLFPFTKILAPSITPFFDGLEKFRRVVLSFRETHFHL